MADSSNSTANLALLVGAGVVTPVTGAPASWRRVRTRTRRSGLHGFPREGRVGITSYDVRVIWRQARGVRLTAYGVIVALTTFQIAAIAEARSFRFDFTHLAYLGVVAVLIGQLRSYVELTDWDLTIQNPLVRYNIRLLDIDEVAGSLALWVRTREGRVVKASAVVATRISRGQRARIEEVVDQIRAAMTRARETSR